MTKRRAKALAVPIWAKQHKFRQSNAWMRGFVGGRGSGKTRIGALDVCLRARANEPWMGVSPSNVVISETTWPTFKEVAEQLGVWVRGVTSPAHRAIFRTQDGGFSEIVFRSGDNPESLRGPSKAGLWLDEASVMIEDVKLLGIPVLRYKGRMGPCLMTFTPKGRRHWTFESFYDRVEDPETGEIDFKTKDNTELIQAHTLENPFLPPEYYDLIRGHYTAALAAQELAGEFIDVAGLIFNREWFNFVDVIPRDGLRVRYWDRAATPGSGSYTAGVLMMMDGNGRFWIEDVIRGQWSFHERDKIIVETARRDAAKYGNEVLIYTEQEGGSGGKEAAQQMVMKLAGFPVYRDNVSGKRFRTQDKAILPGEAKIVRALPHAAQCEAGNVQILRARWNEDFIEELCMFPDYKHSDQVDASSGAFNKLAGRGGFSAGNIHRPEHETNPSRFGLPLLRALRERNR